MALGRLSTNSRDFLMRNYCYTEHSIEGSLVEGFLNESKVLAEEFPADMQWLNSLPLSIHGNLRGRYVLLDFFTYCCINCMHILPALHQLAEDLPSALVVVGVHSGKFANEKNDKNILDALSRYKITHPVINDANYVMWNSYQIICWPTLVLIDPKGKIVLVSIGESNVLRVVKFVKDCVRVSPPGELSPLQTSIPSEIQTETTKRMLSYPGKVHYHAETNTIFISDSANNRIVQVNFQGEVVSRYPSCDSPDSPLLTLSGPQGLVVYREGLFLCDTTNHRVVRVPLKNGLLDGRMGEVVAGTGVQGIDLEGGMSGVAQEVSSPWSLDLVALDGIPGCTGDLLVIAVAGTHQIWGYALSDVSITHRGVITSHEQTKVWRLAGNGEEANKNNSYPHKASFAQPSGVSYDGDMNLFIADSESSTIRSVELPYFSVKNVAGGGFDPSDLFSYGDEDGKGTAAKLQHPIGIVCTDTNTLLVADSYNHKLKLINTKSRVVSTIQEVTGLSEPSGLSFDKWKGEVYVADTNNHSIRVVKAGTWKNRALEIVDKGSRAAKITGVSWVERQDSCGSLTLNLVFTNKLNHSASSSIKIISREISEIPIISEHPEIPFADGEISLNLLITLFTCSEDGACFMKKYTHRINFVEKHHELRQQSQTLDIQLD